MNAIIITVNLLEASAYGRKPLWEAFENNKPEKRVTFRANGYENLLDIAKKELERKRA